MSDTMRQIPFGQLIEWALTEYAQNGSIFGVSKLYRVQGKKRLELFHEHLELPFGPAAGPHSQLAQNLVAGYVAGGRFFELKTVQVLDGEDLPVAKPCILATDEAYNVEWSTELYVPQAFDEYVKGWFALKLLSRELGLGEPDGFIFNMSVGYDLAGIKTEKIDDFIEGLKNAEHSEAWHNCKQWALANLSRFKKVDAPYINSIPARICDSITLSTLHGCPPAEIERIAAYLLSEKQLNTYIKCNPTLLGYEYARATLDRLGFDYVAFDDHHFKADLQFGEAVPMLLRLLELAKEQGLAFGVKLTNTLPVQITAGELPGAEMYMSGRALFPLALAVAQRLSAAFEGQLPISYSGGADAHNIDKIFATGIWPISLATTLLKPGGYQRLPQLAAKLAACEYPPFKGVDLAKLTALLEDTAQNPLYRKPLKPAAARKIKEQSPLTDCFRAPCQDGCPLGQDIPAYLRLADEGRYQAALRVIMERNPLPFITGAICPHRCTDKCARSFYEAPLRIREVKLQVAERAYAQLLKETQAPTPSGGRVAIIGAGPAGLAAAYFLARAGRPVTIFEKRSSAGGMVRWVIPSFRISAAAIDKDVELIRAMGVEIRLNYEISRLDELREHGYQTVVIATGAWKPVILELEGGQALGALEFLASAKNDPAALQLGENVAVIGGGNTAMDAARAALRLPGVKKVSIVYRRSKRYMPADEEELALALAEGVEFCELLAPLRFAEGGLICEQMKLGGPDASGRRSPLKSGKTSLMPADTVISAIGDVADKEYFQTCGINVDAKGQAIVAGGTQESNLLGVYIIGDARRGPATVAEAIADALSCTAAILKTDAPPYNQLNVNPDPQSAADKKGALCLDLAGGREASRCLECATICEFCAEVCPNRANVVVTAGGRPQIIHVDYLCNECGNCGVFCPYAGAPYRDKFTLFACAEDFEQSENQGFLPLPGGGVRLRLNGGAADYADIASLPKEISPLVRSALKRQYLLGR